MPDTTDTVHRRHMLAGLSALGAATVVGPAQAATEKKRPSLDELKKALDVKNPLWNRDAYAKLNGNTDQKSERFGWYSGVVLGVRDGEAVRELLGFEGFSVSRLERAEDGSWKKMLREVGYYKDPKTNEILSTWLNPYTNETVPVVHIANDPYNYIISEFYPDPPSKGGLNTVKPPKRPLLLGWHLANENLMTLATDIHLYYKSPLQPEKWPRESAGPMVRASEMYRFNIDPAEMADPNRTVIHAAGVWNRITPWLPWMLMGQTPGHVIYAANMASADTIDIVPAHIREYTAKTQPKYLTAPTTFIASTESSLELYAKNQKPAPVKGGV